MENEKNSLEQFILNNPELEKLEGMLSDFNLFETLNLIHAEIRHSNVLSWLLNPSQNHGLGSYFLNLFLKHFISENNTSVEGLDIFSIEMLNYSNVEVRREWKNIDILILIEEEDQKIAVGIENKIKSSEHGQQLYRYRQELEKEFSSYKKVYIYLTPEISIPSDDCWVNFNYGTVSGLIDQILHYRKDQLNEQIFAFIEQYNKILKRYIVGNSEIEKICKQLYKKHKTALDLIFQYKPDILADISNHIQKLIHEHPDTLFDSAGKTSIRFSTKAIDQKVPRISEGWLKSKRLLAYEIYNYDDRLAVRLYIAPGNDNARKELFDFFARKKALFNLAKGSLHKKYHCVFQREFLKRKDFNDREFPELVEIINKKWKEFTENQLPQVDEYIKNLPADLDRYKQSGQN